MQDDSDKGGEAPLCKCGCGQEVKWNKHSKRWNSILKGHTSPCKKPNLCLCGCGNETKIGNKYCKGHFKHTEENKKKFGQPGELNPFYGKTHSDETKKKISDARMGQVWTEEQRIKTLATKAATKEAKKLTQPPKESIQCLCGCGEMTNPGAKHIRGHHNRNKSEETKKRISIALTGKTTWKKGLTAATDSRILAGDKHPRPMLGKRHSEESKDKMSYSQAKRIGRNLDNWTRKRKTLQGTIRNCDMYKKWRDEVFKKDEYLCVECKKTSNSDFNAHHIKHFNTILCDNKIDTLDEDYLCEELWDLNNGITLCEECHKNKHKNK